MTTPHFVSNTQTCRLNDQSLWAEVRDGYLAETPTRGKELTNEITCIRSAMQYFKTDGVRRYLIVGFLGVGGAGIVFKVWDTTLLTSRALKIARPIEGKEDLVAGLLSEEISRLQEVSHPNVIAIFDAGTLDSTAGTLPFYTMTFLRGALNARKYFLQSRSTTQLFEFLRGLFAGVQHLHSADLLHLDLKPSNVFVAEDGYPVVADLGGARKIVGDTNDPLTITCTTSYAHPELSALTSLTTGQDDNRRRGNLLRGQLKFEFDRFALGRTILEVVRAFDINSPAQLSSYQRKYVLLQAARLLDGRTTPLDRPLGLTESTLDRLKYESICQAAVDFDKLLGRVNLLEEIPELSSTTDSVIQVTRGRKTRITPRLEQLLREPLVRRLGSVSQLGLVRLVYPGASHTRLEHSLGAFSNAAEYIIALYNDPINPLFRQIMSERHLISTLLAALLHDLGQYQHAHDLDDVEPNVFKHDIFTISLLKGTRYDFQPLTESLRTLLKKRWGVSAEEVVAILEANPNNFNSDIRNRILHTTISGPLDVDKLDYLIRDSDHCQTAFGNGLDRSRLLSTLTVVYQREGRGDDQYFALGIHEKGRAAAESLGFIRFQMFRAVYWHHAVRAAKAMLQRATLEWIAPERRDASKNDRFKSELHAFVLQSSEFYKKAAQDSQQNLFEPATQIRNRKIGYRMRPQWSGLDRADVMALEWIYQRTTNVGKQLIEAIIRRELFKRVFVISATQDPPLWDRIQRDITSHDRLRDRSEAVRQAIKRRVDEQLEGALATGKQFFVSGVGEDMNSITRAAKVLGGKGMVLLDVPSRRAAETLRFYPEDLHRGQREDFDAPALLAVSELWKLLSDNLHESAGSIRLLVHPNIDVLRISRLESAGKPLMDSQALEEDLRKVFPE